MQLKKSTYNGKKILMKVIFLEVIFWMLFSLLIFLVRTRFPNEFYFRYPIVLVLNLFMLLLYFILFNQRKQLHSLLNRAPERLINSFLLFTPDKQYWRKWLLFRFAFLMFTIALAQPLFGSKKAMSLSKNSEVVLALDVSNSMNTKDIDDQLSRLDIAKRATIQLINGLKGERLGVLIFAGNAFVQLPMTKDYNSAKLFVNEIETKMISNQGTNFEIALEKAIDMFSEGHAGKAILMVTDGENHEKIPDKTIEKLPKNNIFLAVVGLGTKNGGLVPKDPDKPYAGYKTDERGQPVLSKMDSKLVKAMAKKAKGIAVISDNPFPNLSDLLTEINGISKGNLRDLNLDIKQAYYQWPLVIGIILWIFATVLPFHRKKGTEYMNKLSIYLLVALVSIANFAQASVNDEAPVKNKDWRSLLTIARKAYQTKDYQKAILFYETLLPNLPKEINLSEEIAQTRYRLKQYDAAAELYEIKSKTDAEAKARSFHNLGNIAMEKKDYKKAIEQYQNALRSNPSNEKTRYNLSEAIRKQKEEDKKNPPPKDEQKDNSKNQPKDKPKNEKEDPKNQNPSALNDQSVQRELEKLMKKEAETKRKVASGKGDKNGVKSQKDW